MQTNDFVFTVSLTGLLLGILIIAAIVAIVWLIKVLSKVSKTMDVVSDLVDHNKEELDLVFKTIPQVTGKVDKTLDQANQILDHSSDEITESIASLKSTLVNASRLSEDAVDTVEYLSRTAIDAADTLTGGVAQTHSTLSYVKEIAKIVRDIVK